MGNRSTHHDKIALAMGTSTYEPALLVKACFIGDAATAESA
jgi:hypothetical protein